MENGVDKSKYDCNKQARLCNILNEMENIVSKVVTLNDDDFFDEVSSARTLEGLLTNFNKQVERHAFSNLASVDLDSSNLILAFGCTKT